MQKKSSSGILYGMVIDLSLPDITCPEAARAVRQGQRRRVDTADGEIRCGDRLFRTNALPQFVPEIVDEGGLTNWRAIKRRRAIAT